MSKRTKQPVTWLPIDSRIFPFFHFSHVKGVARIFLIVEIILSVTVVTGTIVLTIIQLAL